MSTSIPASEKEILMAKRDVIVDEWLVVLRGPRGAEKGRMSVEIENVGPKDRAMSNALRGVLRVWLAATRGARR